MTTEATTSLGSRLRSLREERGWSQRELARRVDGLHQPDLSAYETGRVAPGLGTLVRVAGALGLSLAELLEGVGE